MLTLWRRRTEGSGDGAWQARLWRILSLNYVQDSLAAMAVAIACVPFLGPRQALAWLAFVLATCGAEALLRSGRSRRGLMGDLLELARTVSTALLGLHLFSLHDSDAASVAMGTFGIMVFRAIVADYRRPLQLLIRVGPPLAAGIGWQIFLAIDQISAGSLARLSANLALMAFLIAAVTTVYMTLVERRRAYDKVLAESSTKTVQVEEAHRVAVLAEQLAGTGHFRVDLRTLASTFSDGLFNLYELDPSLGVPGLETVFSRYDGADQVRIREMIAEVVNSRMPVRIEARCRLEDGREKVILTQTNPEFDESGAVRAVFGISMDVTEARLRETALAESEARLRLLADNVTDIVIWISAGGKILYASPSAATLGYAPEAMVGLWATDLIHPDDHGEATRLLNRVFKDQAGGGELKGEFRFLTRDREDRTVWLEGYASAIRDPEGRPRSAVINFRDVTGRRTLEEDLRAETARAEAAARAKSEFLANMSHEIRTPLTGVIGFSGLLAQLPDLPPEARTYVAKVIGSGESLLTVVNDILDFSKLEAGQVELDPAPFDLRGFLDEVAGLFTVQAAARGLKLDVRVSDPAPDYVTADRGRVRQVLSNLLSNAIKFTETGSIRVHADYAAERSALVISVTDTGVGIDEDIQEKLFQRFTQADGSISRRYGGTGLGLSICRQLTGLMGGSIRVASTRGAGSTFTFDVEAPAAEAPQAPPEDADADEGLSACLEILVVDDLDANRELVRVLLEAARQTVHEASGGAQAVSLAVRRGFDLILMDLQMPGMDGFATTKAIRQLSPDNRTTPIIALSANVLPEHVAEAERAGMNDHIGKPIVPARLVALLNRWAGVRVPAPPGQGAD